MVPSLGAPRGVLRGLRGRGMADREPPPEDPEPKAPLWVVTYGDLVSLLVTFFVLIFTFSSIDPDTFRRVKGSLRGAMGIMTEDEQKSKDSVKQPTVMSGDDTSQNGQPDRPDRNSRALKDELEARIQDPSIYKNKLLLRKYPDGVRVSLVADALFDRQGRRLSQSGEQLIREVARFFREENVNLVVEAHTDDRTHEFVSDADAKGLTQRMALKTAQIILDETKWIPPRVGVSPQGDLRPVSSNDDDLGRRANRRVDILVLHKGS